MILSKDIVLLAEQCRAARALLNLSQKQLADSSGVSLRSIQGFEAGERELQGVAKSAITRFLEAEGILLISSHDTTGVLRRHPS